MTLFLATAVLLFLTLSWFTANKLCSRSRPISAEPIEKLLESDGPVTHVARPEKRLPADPL